MSFDEEIEAHAKAAEDLEFVDLPAVVNGKLRTFRIFKMDPLAWADAADRFPARSGVLLDRQYGYNIRPLSIFLAPTCVQILEGDTFTETTPKQWKILAKTLAPRTVLQLGDVMWNLNDYMPEQAVEALKKASAAESALNSESPENTESPAADSSAGSRKKSRSMSTTTKDESSAQ